MSCQDYHVLYLETGALYLSQSWVLTYAKRLKLRFFFPGVFDESRARRTRCSYGVDSFTETTGTTGKLFTLF